MSAVGLPAAALAVLLCGARTPAADEHIAVVLSGGNADAVTFAPVHPGTRVAPIAASAR